MELSNSYVNVDLDAIRQNMELLGQKAGTPLLAAVKADAYGHGAVAVARCIEDQCSFFGVASVAEAVELQEAGITKPILVLGHVAKENLAEVVARQIRVPIFTLEDAQELSRQAVRQGKTAKFHFAVDTGMGRIGFLVSAEAADTCAQILQLPGIEAEGLFSHFATADTEDLTRTYAQAERFAAFDQMLRQRGVQVQLRHLHNSAGTMYLPHSYEMSRAGIAIYGIYPSDEVDHSSLKLQPAMSWHTSISALRQLPAGSQISYGGTFETQRPTLVATIPVGYADGYRRSLSNRFFVLIRGKEAPILGRICMDQFMVDVTDIPGVQVGDEVTLLGKNADREITVEQLSAAANSFPYEQVCDIGRRVTRRYYQNGKLVSSVNYLLDK